jgi:DUF4097 and DUF4098 domain-containing protein YvlB
MTGKALLALSFLSLAACDFEDFDGQRYKEEFHNTYDLKPGGRLELETFNGSVELTGWDRDTVDISGTKYASRKEYLEAMKIEIAAAPDSVRIRTVRPTSSGWRGNMGAKYVIRVPRRTILDRIVSSNGSIRVEQIESKVRLKTSNGTVRVERSEGDVEAITSNGSVELADFKGGATVHTSNGSIKADGLRGFFDATTSNGSVDARIAEATPGRPVKVESSNGRVNLAFETPKIPDISVSTSNSSITVRLPDGANARLRASTSNSSITTDFEVTASGTISKTRLEGSIGSGGPVVDLRSSNGAIRIVKN